MSDSTVHKIVEFPSFKTPECPESYGYYGCETEGCKQYGCKYLLNLDTQTSCGFCNEPLIYYGELSDNQVESFKPVKFSLNKSRKQYNGTRVVRIGRIHVCEECNENMKRNLAGPVVFECQACNKTVILAK